MGGERPDRSTGFVRVRPGSAGLVRATPAPRPPALTVRCAIVMNEHGRMTSAQIGVDWVVDHEALVAICSLTVSEAGWR